MARFLVRNDTLKARVAALALSPAEFFKVTLRDGATLDGWMIRPRDFDSTRTYPLLMYVYGEPAGQTVVDAWSYAERLWYQLLADQGYIVASVDNRGTPAPKGRAWRKVVYGQIGVLSSARAGGCRAGAHPDAIISRPVAGGDLGLERRRVEHAAGDVPLSRSSIRSA